MTVLITGSKGYLGSVLSLNMRAVPFIGIDLGLFNNYDGLGFIKKDLSKDSLSSIFTDHGNIDTVIHLAGISNDPSSEINDKLTHRMNIEASKRLIDYASASGVKRFIFASSASVYGFNSSLVTEESTPSPITPYAKSKLEIEKYLENFPNMHPIIFRFGTLFGASPKMRFDLAINLMTRSAILDGKITVNGTGEQFRPFLHVRDAAFAIIGAIGRNNPTGIFNIASSNIRIRSLAEMVSDVTGSDIIFESVDHPDSRDYKMDCTKSASELSFGTINPILFGINEVAYWVSKNKEMAMNRDFHTISAWKDWIKNENPVF